VAAEHVDVLLRAGGLHALVDRLLGGAVVGDYVRPLVAGLTERRDHSDVLLTAVVTYDDRRVALGDVRADRGELTGLDREHHPLDLEARLARDLLVALAGGDAADAL